MQNTTSFFVENWEQFSVNTFNGTPKTAMHIFINMQAAVASCLDVVIAFASIFHGSFTTEKNNYPTSSLVAAQAYTHLTGIAVIYSTVYVTTYAEAVELLPHLVTHTTFTTVTS